LHTSHEEVLLLGPNTLTAIIDGRGWFEEKRRSIELTHLAVCEGLDRLLLEPECLETLNQ
jgi:hypothetical protein